MFKPLSRKGGWFLLVLKWLSLTDGRGRNKQVEDEEF